MSNATNKLEMSLDDIIKTQKGGKGQNQANKAGLNPRVFKGPINKRRQVETPKGNRRIGIRRQMGGGANNNRNGQLKGRKVVVKRQQMKFGGNLRQNVGNRFGGIRKNVTTNALKNKAMVSVTRNLVQKLAKKALAQNVGTSSVMTRRSSKLIRIPANRLRQRTIVLNKVNPRSRVIARRRVLSMQNSPVMLQKVRGRGPVRFAQNAQPRIISLPSRRNTIQYAQQPIVVQQPRRNFNNNNNNGQQGMSVRQQINAMRRATRVQQLQSQFIKQQQAPNIQMQQRRFVQPPRQQQVSQQQVIVQQQRPRRQQYIILQQQPQRRRQQQQFVTVQQQPRRFFNRQQQRGQGRQQIIQLDPLYNPPNFLQRI